MSMDGERMYGTNRCPQCGGPRLFRRSAKEILVICGGCGLTTTVPDFPSAPRGTNPKTDPATLGGIRGEWIYRFADRN